VVDGWLMNGIKVRVEWGSMGETRVLAGATVQKIEEYDCSLDFIIEYICFYSVKYKFKNKKSKSMIVLSTSL
jgi:hypothetical protein